MDRDAGRELPRPWVAGDAEQRLEGVEQGDQARGLQAAGAAEHGLVGEPGQRVVEERDGEQHAARAVGAGGAEQAERVEGAVDHRAGGRVEVADDLQHDARELGGCQARERAGDLAGVGVGPQAQLLRRPAAGRVAAHDQRRGRPAGEHELDAAGDRRARAAERDLAARGAGRVEREAPRPGHDAGVGRGGRARHGQPASREVGGQVDRADGDGDLVGRRAARAEVGGDRSQRRDERLALGGGVEDRAHVGGRLVQEVVDRVGDAPAGRGEQAEGAQRRHDAAGGAGRGGAQGVGGRRQQHPDLGQRGRDRVDPGRRRDVRGLHDPALARDPERARLVQCQQGAGGRSAGAAAAERQREVEAQAPQLVLGPQPGCATGVRAAGQPHAAAPERDVHGERAVLQERERAGVAHAQPGDVDLREPVDRHVARGRRAGGHGDAYGHAQRLRSARGRGGGARLVA